MTDQDAYRRYTAEAEKLIELARTPLIVTAPERATQQEIDDAAARMKATTGRSDIAVLPINVDRLIDTAGVWATLALAAAQERVQPANRPTDGPISPPAGPINRLLPDKIEDGEGDPWTLDPDNGLYALGGDSKGSAALDEIASAHGGYRVVP